jgi:excisionase family DNA binding protein
MTNLERLGNYSGKYLTPAQCARFADCTVQTIYYQIRREHLRAYRIGSVIKITIEDFRAYLSKPAYPPPVDPFSDDAPDGIPESVKPLSKSA